MKVSDNALLVQKGKEKSNDNSTKRSSIQNYLHQKFHILQWLPKYTKLDLISDAVAGFTLGLTMMPQAIAYAALAGLAPQYGLYSAFMGSFVYVIFGTIKEVSIGPTSLMALLVLSYTKGLPQDYIVLLCFLSGCVELLMGCLKLGFLVDFIPVPVTSGFTSATSVIIILAQMKGLLGLKFDNSSSFDILVKLFTHITNCKIGDTVLGILCIVFLLTLRSLKDVPTENKCIKKGLWLLSISRNALIVLITSVIAYYFVSTQGQAPFKISGNVVAGVPSFHMVNFTSTLENKTETFVDMVHTLGSSVVVVPLVAILANVAIAKSFAAGSVVDATQEMVTLGICNILGSFVQSMPTTGAFTRSAVSNASGVRTPMAGFYTGLIILLALSFLTPYFYYVPKSTLSAVLISAVMFMIDFEIIPKLWKYSKFDLSLTIITFAISLFYGVELGLFSGVCINMLYLLKLWTRPKIYSSISAGAKGVEYILIKPEVGLFYPAVDYFTQEVVKLTINVENVSMPIVIDCTNILRIDYSACQALINLIQTFNKKSVDVILVNVSQCVHNKLKILTDVDKINFCTNEEQIVERFLQNTDVELKEVEVPLLKNDFDSNSVY